MAHRITGVHLVCSRSNVSLRTISAYRKMRTKKEVEVIEAAKPDSSSAPQTATQTMGKGLTGHRTNSIDRIFLVWGGKYKSLKDVPIHVSQDTMELYRNKARIKINIMMGLATLLGCLTMIWSGKLAAQRGESVQSINEEFHRAYKLQKQKELEAAAA